MAVTSRFWVAISEAYRKSEGRPEVVFDREAVRHMRDVEGLGWREIAARLGVGVGTVRRAYERKATARQLPQELSDAVTA